MMKLSRMQKYKIRELMRFIAFCFVVFSVIGSFYIGVITICQ